MIAVVAAGGDGTRLGDVLNPDHISKAFLPFNGKPLVSKLLEQIKDCGITDVVVSFSEPSQKDTFENFIRNKQVPKLNYQYNFHTKFDHPAAIFQCDEIKRILADQDYLFTQSDLLLTRNIMKEMVDVFNEFHCSIALRETARSHDKYQIELTDNFMTGMRLVERAEWRYGGIYIISKEGHPHWINMCSPDDHRTNDYFTDMLKNDKKVYFLEQEASECIINMNYPEDYNKVKDWMEKHENVAKNRVCNRSFAGNR